MITWLAKSILIILPALVFFAAETAAQANCDWQSKPAALPFDLRIGMSPEQARATLGGALKIKIKKPDARTFFQNFIKKPPPEPLRGVRALYLRFFERKLYQIEIFYEPRPDLPNLEAVRSALAAQFDLTAADWQIKNNRARLECGGNSLVADYVLNPRVELTSETVRAEVEAAREKTEK